MSGIGGPPPVPYAAREVAACRRGPAGRRGPRPRSRRRRRRRTSTGRCGAGVHGPRHGRRRTRGMHLVVTAHQGAHSGPLGESGSPLRTTSTLHAGSAAARSSTQWCAGRRRPFEGTLTGPRPVVLDLAEEGHRQAAALGHHGEGQLQCPAPAPTAAPTRRADPCVRPSLRLPPSSVRRASPRCPSRTYAPSSLIPEFSAPYACSANRFMRPSHRCHAVRWPGPHSSRQVRAAPSRVPDAYG